MIEGWLPTQIANGNNRTLHWTRKREIKEADAEHVFVAIRQARWHHAPGRPRLEIQMIFPTRARRDKDNLYARVKALVDALKRLRMFDDDDTEHLDLVVHDPIVERKRRATCLKLIG